MSFVTTNPEALTVAAGNLQVLGSAMAAQNAAAAAPTTGVLPAAADEVSALQATQFAAYGTLYQQISAQATAIQDLFVHTLRTSADTYGATEAANSVAAAPAGTGLNGSGLNGSGLASSGISGAGLAATGLTGGAATDPSFGLGGVLSNSAILAAMQAGNIGSASSEFTGLGKGYISEPAGVMGSVGPVQAALVSDTAPAVTATPVSAGMGQAASAGGLSVPPSWAGEAAAPTGTTRPISTGWTTAVPHSTPVTTMPAGMPAMASAERGGFGFGTPRYGVKPKVMPRPTVV